MHWGISSTRPLLQLLQWRILFSMDMLGYFNSGESQLFASPYGLHRRQKVSSTFTGNSYRKRIPGFSFLNPLYHCSYHLLLQSGVTGGTGSCQQMPLHPESRGERPLLLSLHCKTRAIQTVKVVMARLQVPKDKANLPCLEMCKVST